MVATAKQMLAQEEEALLRRAEVALHSLRSSYAAEASRQLEEIESALDRLAGPEQALTDAARDGLFERVFEASHEIKGQAGSFGYDLLTHVCESLCHVVEARHAKACDAVDAVRHHLAAARLIFDQDIKGDGGALGVALLGELGRLKVYLATRSDAFEREPGQRD